VILAAIRDENRAADVPGDSLVESPSASDISEAPVIGHADLGWTGLHSGIHL
jgi:hypothetical protein